MLCLCLHVCLRVVCIVTQALAELGLITTIGTAISDVIKSVGEESRLLAAIVIIIWVSALASSFIDNIPYTTAMVSCNVYIQMIEVSMDPLCYLGTENDVLKG